MNEDERIREAQNVQRWAAKRRVELLAELEAVREVERTAARALCLLSQKDSESA